MSESEKRSSEIPGQPSCSVVMRTTPSPQSPDDVDVQDSLASPDMACQIASFPVGHPDLSISSPPRTIVMPRLSVTSIQHSTKVRFRTDQRKRSRGSSEGSKSSDAASPKRKRTEVCPQLVHYSPTRSSSSSSNVGNVDSSSTSSGGDNRLGIWSAHSQDASQQHRSPRNSRADSRLSSADSATDIQYSMVHRHETSASGGRTTSQYAVMYSSMPPLQEYRHATLSDYLPAQPAPNPKSRQGKSESAKHRGKCRKSYTVQQKLGAIALRKSGLTVSQVAVRYAVTPKMVRDWCRHEEELHDMAADQIGDGKSKRKLHPGRKPRNANLDKLLHQMYLEETSRGRRVKNKDLQQMALQLASDLGEKGFRASSMFLRRWKRRYNVDIRDKATGAGEGSSSVPSEGHQELELEYTDDDEEEEVHVDTWSPQATMAHHENIEAASTTAEADVYIEEGSDSESEHSSYDHFSPKRQPMVAGYPPSENATGSSSSVHSYHSHTQHVQVMYPSALPLRSPTAPVAIACDVMHVPTTSGVITTLALSPESPVKQFYHGAAGNQMATVTSELHQFQRKLAQLRRKNSYAVDGIVCMCELPVLADVSSASLRPLPRHPITPQGSLSSIPQVHITEGERHVYGHSAVPALSASMVGGVAVPFWKGTSSGGSDANTTCSVVMAACSNGHKLPISIVTRLGKPAMLTGHHYLSSPHGQVSPENIWYILQNVFLQSTKETDPRRLLLLPEHWAPLMTPAYRKFVTEACRSDVLFVPAQLDPFAWGGLASTNQQFIATFSGLARGVDMSPLTSQQQLHGTAQALSAHHLLEQRSKRDAALQLLVATIQKTWERTPTPLIQTSFQACGL